MGAKTSKQTKEAPASGAGAGASTTTQQNKTPVNKQTNRKKALEGIIDLDTDFYFPDEEVLQELRDLAASLQPIETVKIGVLDSSSKMREWVQTLDYEDSFFYNLAEELCSTSDMRAESWANYLSFVFQDMGELFLFAFTSDGNIAGMSVIGRDWEKDGYMRRFFTCTNPRKRGVGKALVDKVHEIAVEQGFKGVRLGAATKTAKAWHEHMNYIHTGRNLGTQGAEMIYNFSTAATQTPAKRKTRKHRRT